MNENRKKDKNESKSSHRKSKRRSSSSSSTHSSDSGEWVEKDSKQNKDGQREDWMSMTGMLKTYTKDDIKPKHEEKDKKHIDSYNPATSTRELNPYWRDGGSGLPQTPEGFQRNRKSKPFLKPSNDEDDYYSKSKSSRSHTLDAHHSRHSKPFVRPTDDDDNYYSRVKSRAKDSHSSRDSYDNQKDNKDRNYERGSYRSTSSWRKQSEVQNKRNNRESVDKAEASVSDHKEIHHNEKIALPIEQPKESKFLSDEKMNKLAAKIVKAEILGDTKLVSELQAKLEAAREYRKQNPLVKNEVDNEREAGIMLISTNSSGNSRPLAANNEKGDPRSKSGKRKAETHVSGERTKYFGNDDKYDLKQMFEEEKYGGNYNNEAELAKIASKHKNPNDDLEDIFMDEISKNRNPAKDKDLEKQRAINQHVRMEKSLEGCEYCVDSKNMLKHLMVSIGSKVYLSVPARKSLTENHCIISTIQHSTCVTAVDEDVWEEILAYRKALTRFYNSQDKDVVFCETAMKLHKHPHLVINCVPLPRDVGDMAAIYFKKALLECESEWAMNKKVVDLKGKNVRKGIPKGLPYFWVDFGMDPGFAHVIEDQHLFPKNFAETIIGGMLDLDHSLWKNPRRDYGDVQRKKAMEFLKEWKEFDPTKNQ